MRSCAALLIALSCLGGGALARAGEPAKSPALAHWWSSVVEAIDLIAEARRGVPPVPVEVQWRARRLGTLELGAEMLDLHALQVSSADPGVPVPDVLAVLSTDTLRLVAVRGSALQELVAAPLPSIPASIRSRDPIGSISVHSDEQGLELRVRTSDMARAARYAVLGEQLQELGEVDGYPVCDGASVESASGRNYFDGSSLVWDEHPEGKLDGPVLSVSCARVRGPSGKSYELLASVSLLDVLTLGCVGPAEQCPVAAQSYEGAGHAHLIADIDNDGYPEVVLSGNGARGEPDRVVVSSQRGDTLARIYDKGFTSGIVAMTAGDLNGDGKLQVVVAVRAPGSGRATLWVLN